MPATDHVTQCEAVVRHYIDALGRGDTDTLVRDFVEPEDGSDPLIRLMTIQYDTAPLRGLL